MNFSWCDAMSCYINSIITIRVSESDWAKPWLGFAPRQLSYYWLLVSFYLANQVNISDDADFQNGLIWPQRAQKQIGLWWWVGFTSLSIAVFSSRIPEMLSNYHNYTQLVSELESLAESYPDLSRIYSVGNSTENRELMVIQITEGVTEVKIVTLNL